MPESWNAGAGIDITCQYAVAGINGGIASLALFVIILVRSFRQLGKAMHEKRGHNAAAEWSLWCLGTALFAHVMNLFSVSYFDQIHVVWWGFLAIISSVTSQILKTEPSTEVVEDVPEALHGETVTS